MGVLCDWFTTLVSDMSEATVYHEVGSGEYLTRYSRRTG